MYLIRVIRPLDTISVLISADQVLGGGQDLPEAHPGGEEAAEAGQCQVQAGPRH